MVPVQQRLEALRTVAKHNGFTRRLKRRGFTSLRQVEALFHTVDWLTAARITSSLVPGVPHLGVKKESQVDVVRRLQTYGYTRSEARKSLRYGIAAA